MDHLPMSRIEVETEADWLRVKENVYLGMKGAMDARLSSLPGGKDGEVSKGVKKELEMRLAKIQEELFDLTNPNLRVNGHNYEDFVEATEPFDEILDRRIKALDTERVSWNAEVAGRRKRVPRDIHGLEADLERRRSQAEWLEEGEDEGGLTAEKTGRKAEDIPPPPRHKETIETFNTVVSNLAELASSAPAQLARAQRAKTVRDEIANMPP